ncbi:MAG: hypothetical protein ACMUHM_08995 [Thermoplasmatota archaeon]
MFEGYEGPNGINCIRECIHCGLTERYTHMRSDDGVEVHNRTVLSGPSS